MIDFLQPSLYSVLIYGSIFSILIGIPIIILISLNPHWFWPSLIIGVIIGNGPKIVGYSFLDEFFAIVCVIGAISHLLLFDRHSISYSVKVKGNSVFFLWMFYLIIQTIVGIIIHDDIRLFRYILIFSVLIVMQYIVLYKNNIFTFPQAKNLFISIILSLIVEYSAYIIQGIYFESVFGTAGRFLSQSYIWVGSAVAVFPTLIGIPAALFLLKENSKKIKIIAWVTIGIMIGVALYFDSRISWMVIIGFVFILWKEIKLKRIVFFYIIFILITTQILKFDDNRIEMFYDELIQTAQVVWDPKPTDARSRFLQFESGFNTWVGIDLYNFIAGAGFYSHRILIVPFVEKALIEYLDWGDFITYDRGVPIIRTTGFPALLIDTGLIGILLLFVLCKNLVQRILLNKSSFTSPAILIIFFALSWLFVANILDIILWYLILMSNGLIEQLNEKMKFNLIYLYQP